MEATEQLSSRLADARRVLRRRRGVLVVCCAVGGLSALLLLFEIAERAVGFREATAFGAVSAATAFAVLGFLAVMVRGLLRQPSPVALARAVERRHPDLLDSLNTAVEREAIPERERRVLEDALVVKVRRDTNALDFRSAVIPRWLEWRVLILGGITASVLAVGVLHTRVMAKAECFLRSRYFGEAAGLVVEPGEVDVPVHSDVTVDASVRRWERRADIVYEDHTGRRYRFPMNPADEGYAFTFYDVSEKIRYRVETPALVSAWYSVSVFRSPEILDFECTVTPPVYTRRPTRTFKGLQDISVVEGSGVDLTIEVSPDVSAHFMSDAASHRFRAVGNVRRSHQLTAWETLSFAIRLVDEDGHESRSGEVALEAIRDLPPVLDVLLPGKDTVAQPGNDVEMRVRAGDDFGLQAVQLHVSVSGRSPQAMTLYPSQADSDESPATDLTLSRMFSPAAVGAGTGDMIAYYFTATDTREPAPQTLQSDVFFLEIRPEVEPREMEGGGDVQRINVAALVAESKRLIRVTHDLLSMESKIDDDMRRDLKTALSDLQLETERVLEQLKRALPPGMADRLPLYRAFEGARADVRRAETLVEEGLVEESMQPQQRALSVFVKIAQELARNMQGEQSGQQASEDSRNQPPEEEDMQKRADEYLRQLQELSRTLNRLADRQAAANQRIQRLKDSQLSESMRAELSRSQGDIERSTRTTMTRLPRAPQLNGVRQQMQRSVQAMSAAQSDVSEARLTQGLRQGIQAHRRLLAAADQVREQARRLSANQLTQLVHQARMLADEERRAAEASGRQSSEAETAEEEIARLRDRQSTLRKQTDELLLATERATTELRERHPPSASAVSRALQDMRDANVGGLMARAGNALLYRVFDKAQKYQEDAATHLDAFAAALEDAALQLPQISQEELMRALQQIADAQKRLQHAQGQPGDEAREAVQATVTSMGQALATLSDQMKNPALREIARHLQSAAQVESAGSAATRTYQLLGAAARVIEQSLAASEVERLLRLSRRSTRPPEKYERLVEEYFKELSEPGR